MDEADGGECDWTCDACTGFSPGAVMKGDVFGEYGVSLFAAAYPSRESDCQCVAIC